MNYKDSISCAKQVIRIESEAIQALADRIGAEFERAVELIARSTGRVIVTGMGKSGIVAEKIAATLRSTGTAAFFLHPAEGVHGDLGMVLKNDVVICISKSGSTGELTQLFPLFKRIGVPVITLTGNLKSSLAERSDIVLDVSVKEEACPHDLAPTASSTAALVMGDALAVALLERRDFSVEDFALLHPGGSLGKKLLRIDEVMFTGDKVPIVPLNANLRDVIVEITRKRFGGTCVVDIDGKLAGVITDGDFRRRLERTNHIWEIIAKDMMNPQPKVVKLGELATVAKKVMENHNIMQVIIVDEDKPVGMVHLHDLLEAGVE